MSVLIKIVKEKYKNKTNIPQVVFDAYGNPVTVPPGKTVEYKKKVAVKIPEKGKADGESK